MYNVFICALRRLFRVKSMLKDGTIVQIHTSSLLSHAFHRPFVVQMVDQTTEFERFYRTIEVDPCRNVHSHDFEHLHSSLLIHHSPVKYLQHHIT